MFRKALFEQLRSFMRIWESWAPALVVRWTHPSKEHLLESLRVFRDDFEILRDVYIQVYETCCRALPVVTAVMNADERGDPNLFGSVPASILQANARATSPSNLAAFEKLPNANKLQWFQDWPAWADGLPVLLDKRIRNTVGHASAHCDVQSGNVVGDDFEMSYLNFTTATFDLFYPLFTLLQVVKFALSGGEHAAGRARPPSESVTLRTPFRSYNAVTPRAVMADESARDLVMRRSPTRTRSPTSSFDADTGVLDW